jgi:glutamate/tyrosine decarboxylase-like PLP-dependent enzyme
VVLARDIRRRRLPRGDRRRGGPRGRIADEIERRDEFVLVRRPQLGVVVFERVGWQKADYDRWSARLLDEQHAFVTPSSHAGRTNARFAILNPRTTYEDLVGILETMR